MYKSIYIYVYIYRFIHKNSSTTHVSEPISDGFRIGIVERKVHPSATHLAYFTVSL